MKLTLTHIQHYPIGGENALKVMYRNNVCDIIGLFETTVSIQCGNDTFVTSIDNCKHLLRLMSDLYKEIDGEIGIVELAKIASKIFGLDFHVKHFDKDTKTVFSTEDYEFGFTGLGFYLLNSKGDNADIDQLALFEYLFANHYDVFDLIGQNFKHSCFIENSQEAREWLEGIGYEENKIEPQFKNADMLMSNYGDYIVFPKDNTDYIYDEDINCTSNLPLFKALTAVRDDSDVDQYFVCDKDYIDACDRDTDEKGTFREWFRVPRKWMHFYHKATKEEIVEHFKIEEDE